MSQDALSNPTPTGTGVQNGQPCILYVLHVQVAMQAFHGSGGKETLHCWGTRFNKHDVMDMVRVFLHALDWRLGMLVHGHRLCPGSATRL